MYIHVLHGNYTQYTIDGHKLMHELKLILGAAEKIVIHDHSTSKITARRVPPLRWV